MIGALPQTPEFIAFVFPKMGRKNRRQKSAAHFGVKSVQPLRSHSCVAVSCRTEKANYIINNCLEDYSIYTVCATLPHNTSTCGLHIHLSRRYFGDSQDEQDLHIAKLILLISKFYDGTVFIRCFQFLINLFHIHCVLFPFIIDIILIR